MKSLFAPASQWRIAELPLQVAEQIALEDVRALVLSLLALLAQKYAVYLLSWYKRGCAERVRGRPRAGTQFACFTGTQVRKVAEHSAFADVRALVLSLLALLVQKYKY